MQPFVYRDAPPTPSFSHNEPNTIVFVVPLSHILYLVALCITKDDIMADLHCRAACRCSPGSAGPFWPPSDTADIHKNRLCEEEGEGGGRSDDRARQTCVGGRRRTNNDVPKATRHKQWGKQTAVCLFETSRRQRLGLDTAAVFCAPVGPSQCIPHDETAHHGSGQTSPRRH